MGPRWTALSGTVTTSLERPHQCADIDREAGPECAVLVLERRLEADGAAGRIHFVVDQREQAFAQRRLAVGRQRPDLHRPGRQGFFDRGQILLGRGIHDRDRLQLRDLDNSVLV